MKNSNDTFAQQPNLSTRPPEQPLEQPLEAPLEQPPEQPPEQPLEAPLEQDAETDTWYEVPTPDRPFYWNTLTNEATWERQTGTVLPLPFPAAWFEVAIPEGLCYWNQFTT